jgi:hypothetical protein
MESRKLYFALNPMFQRPLLDVLNSTFGMIATIVKNVLPGSILSKIDMKILPMSSKITCHFSLALNIEIEKKRVIIKVASRIYVYRDCTYQELK